MEAPGSAMASRPEISIGSPACYRRVRDACTGNALATSSNSSFVCGGAAYPNWLRITGLYQRQRLFLLAHFSEGSGDSFR